LGTGFTGGGVSEKFVPEKLNIVRDDGDTHIYTESGESIMCNMNYYPWVPEKIGYWNLFAASPDLYDALVLARKEMIDSGNWYAHDYGWPKAKLAVDSALAKARGEISE